MSAWLWIVVGVVLLVVGVLLLIGYFGAEG
jgi:uncharacterized membrane protein HdeD (DUF308 family)